MDRAAALVLNHPRGSALALGLIAATGFEPLHLWPLALLALAGLIALIARAATLRRAALLGWLFALTQFALGLNWIATAFSFQDQLPSSLGWLAVLGIAAYLAIYPALATALAWRFGRANLGALILMLAASWTLCEWLRGWVFTGFPWNPLAGLALGPFDRPGLAMLAKWLGTYGLSGLVIILAGAWLVALERRRFDWRGVVLILLPALLLGLFPGKGPEPVGRPGPAFTLVQPNISQDVLHNPESYGDQFDRAARLSLPRQPDQQRVVLWPESGTPELLRDGYPAWAYRSSTYMADPALARARLGRLAGPNGLLLTGNDDFEVRGEDIVGARNAVTALDGQGRVRGSYYKAHLVPYGEYVPLKWLLGPLGLARFVPGDIEFWPGPGTRTMELGPWGRPGVLICYEIIFPGEVTDRANRPDYLFNPSNEGWYGAWGPPQFLAQARLRAIEEGLPVLRATTTGISAVIDARGLVQASIAPGRADRIDGQVPPALPPTLFARLGNALSLGWAIVFLLLSLVANRRRQV